MRILQGSQDSVSIWSDMFGQPPGPNPKARCSGLCLSAVWQPCSSVRMPSAAGVRPQAVDSLELTWVKWSEFTRLVGIRKKKQVFQGTMPCHVTIWVSGRGNIMCWTLSKISDKTNTASGGTMWNETMADRDIRLRQSRTTPCFIDWMRWTTLALRIIGPSELEGLDPNQTFTERVGSLILRVHGTTFERKIGHVFPPFLHTSLSINIL